MTADPRVDLYIDGLLEGEELAAFERELGESAVLRGQIESQELIDSGLRKLFAYDPSRAVLPASILGEAGDSARNGVIGRIDGSTATRGAARASAPWSRLRIYAMAAAVLLAAAGIWATYVHLTTPSFEKLLSPAEVYAMVDKPEFICKDDREFADAVNKRLGQPLVLAMSPGVSALGWAYGDDYNGKIVGPKTMVLINKVDDQKVLVFMDRRREDRKLEVPAGSGLKLFRKEIGALVVYEVTPLDRARVIEQLKTPQ